MVVPLLVGGATLGGLYFALETPTCFEDMQYLLLVRRLCCNGQKAVVPEHCSGPILTIDLHVRSKEGHHGAIDRRTQALALDRAMLGSLQHGRCIADEVMILGVWSLRPPSSLQDMRGSTRPFTPRRCASQPTPQK